MNSVILERYVNRLTKNHIIEFAKKQNITLLNNEIDIIYEYIKKYYKTIAFGDVTNIFKELKCKLSFNTYEKIEELYNIFKEKINK